MALHRFKYYLHDDYESYDRADYILGQLPELDEGTKDFVTMKLADSPFYEVTFECELNDETGEITLVSAKL